MRWRSYTYTISQRKKIQIIITQHEIRTWNFSNTKRNDYNTHYIIHQTKKWDSSLYAWRIWNSDNNFCTVRIQIN